MKNLIKYFIVLFFLICSTSRAENRPIVKITHSNEYELYDAADSIDILQGIADRQAEEIDSLKKVIEAISKDLPKNIESNPKQEFGIWHIIFIVFILFLLYCVIRPKQTVDRLSNWIIKKFFV